MKSLKSKNKNFSLSYEGRVIFKTSIESQQDTALIEIMNTLAVGQSKDYFDISTGLNWKVTKDFDYEK